VIILGIGGVLGDAAAAILKDGELAAAVEESKLLRRRMHWGGRDPLPERAIAMCLELAGAKPERWTRWPCQGRCRRRTSICGCAPSFR